MKRQAKGKPRPKIAPAWPRESLNRRVYMCTAMLNVHGFVTESELRSIRARVLKAQERGEFEERA